MEGILIGTIKGLLVIVAAIMTFFIMLQDGKGSLAFLDGTKASESIGVVNPLRRATTCLAIVFLGMAILLGVLAR